MSNIEIQHSGMMSHIFAKISFDNWMSDSGKHQAKSEWDNFKKQVDEAIKLIKSPEDGE